MSRQSFLQFCRRLRITRYNAVTSLQLFSLFVDKFV